MCTLRRHPCSTTPRDGSSAEIAIVRNERLVGIWLFFGGGSTPKRAVTQSAGQVLIGHMLRARRQGVTHAAGNPEKAGLIRH
jgi:hypothetical protein